MDPIINTFPINQKNVSKDTYLQMNQKPCKAEDYREALYEYDVNYKESIEFHRTGKKLDD